MFRINLPNILLIFQENISKFPVWNYKLSLTANKKSKQTSYPIGSQPACWRSIKSVWSLTKSKMLVRREILHSTPSCWYFFVEYPIEKYRKFHSKSFLKRPREKCFCTLQKPRMWSSAATQYCSSWFRSSQQWIRPIHS